MIRENQELAQMMADVSVIPQQLEAAARKWGITGI
jgi:hypothetical protein